MLHFQTFFNSNFSPRNISNLALWLDAADPSSVIKDASNNVSQWNDKSGKANHASQGTGSAQPLFQPNGLNNLPTLRFADDELNIADAASLDYSSFSIFIVSQYVNGSSGSGGDYILWKWLNSGQLEFIVNYVNDTSPRKQRIQFSSSGTAPGTTLDPSAEPLANVPGIIDVQYSGSAVTMKVNNTLSANAAGTIFNGTDPLRIGRSFTADTLTVSEIIFYTQALSEPQRLSVLSYLKKKWRIV